jgi:hypothetical protein
MSKPPTRRHSRRQMRKPLTQRSLVATTHEDVQINSQVAEVQRTDDAEFKRFFSLVLLYFILCTYVLIMVGSFVAFLILRSLWPLVTFDAIPVAFLWVVFHLFPTKQKGMLSMLVLLLRSHIK